MRKALVVLMCLCACLRAQVTMKRIALLPSGISARDGRVVCYDSDHNGLKELIYATGSNTSGDPLRWEVWEYRPLNRFELVYADTGCWPAGPGMTRGNFCPWDAGDIDRDGLTDLAGQNDLWTKQMDTMYNVLVTYESPAPDSYPKYFSWLDSWGTNQGTPAPTGFASDLDRDSSREIFACTPCSLGWCDWENVGNNDNELAWHSQVPEGAEFAFGDFDGDGRQKFATAFGPTVVMKCLGNNQFELAYADTTGLVNGDDVFSGDVSGDGNPEFFVGFWTYLSQKFDLYMWQATGINTYRRVFVDEKSYISSYWPAIASKCGDIDGDGVAEIVWATPESLYVYKMTGPDQFQQIWQWQQDNDTEQGLFVTIADVNNDGYNEIIASGGGLHARTSIFEIEAVRVLQPNGGETYVPGEDHYIKWQTFTPPRCDSLSVLFTSDNGRTLDLLAHGLPPGTDSILWHVPDVNSDSCKIRVIAYGPGAQADESDSVFSIAPTGQGANDGPPVYETKLLGAYPNPLTRATGIRFQLSRQTHVSLRICDVSGRTVATLADGIMKPGIYHRDWEVAPTVPNGIYFLSFGAGDLRESRKLILTR